MAQIYDRFQIENSHCLSQHIVDTALTRFSEALNRTVVTTSIKYRYFGSSAESVGREPVLAEGHRGSDV